MLDVGCWMFDVRCWTSALPLLLDRGEGGVRSRDGRTNRLHSAFNVRCWAFDVRCSMLGRALSLSSSTEQRSTLDVKRSTLNAERSTSNLLSTGTIDTRPRPKSPNPRPELTRPTDSLSFRAPRSALNRQIVQRTGNTLAALLE